MGVWIETGSVWSSAEHGLTSLPAWECGLKLMIIVPLLLMYVTPRVGVWIETIVHPLRCDAPGSLPAWECGLKLDFFGMLEGFAMSLPAWECGLKPR